MQGHDHDRGQGPDRGAGEYQAQHCQHRNNESPFELKTCLRVKEFNVKELIIIMSWVTWELVSILQRACGHHNRDSALCNNICFNLHVVYMVSYEIHNQNMKWPLLETCNHHPKISCAFFRAVLRIRKKPNIPHCEVCLKFCMELLSIGIRLSYQLFYFRPVVRIK